MSELLDKSAQGGRGGDVFDTLRRDILSGRFKPGETLAFAPLRDRFGVSMGLLRETLQRLTRAGLVEARPNQGFRVISLSLDDMAQLTEARLLVECAAFRDSIENGNLEWETRVIAANHRMERTFKAPERAPQEITDAWMEAHHAFHAALLLAARNQRLVEIADGLRYNAEVYRRWSIPFEDPPRDVPAEHALLVETALARDVERGVEALANHLSLTRQLVEFGCTDDDA